MKKYIYILCLSFLLAKHTKAANSNNVRDYRTSQATLKQQNPNGRYSPNQLNYSLQGPILQQTSYPALGHSSMATVNNSPSLMPNNHPSLVYQQSQITSTPTNTYGSNGTMYENLNNPMKRLSSDSSSKKQNSKPPKTSPISDPNSRPNVSPTYSSPYSYQTAYSAQSMPTNPMQTKKGKKKKKKYNRYVSDHANNTNTNTNSLYSQSSLGYYQNPQNNQYATNSYAINSLDGGMQHTHYSSPTNHSTTGSYSNSASHLSTKPKIEKGTKCPNCNVDGVPFNSNDWNGYSPFGKAQSANTKDPKRAQTIQPTQSLFDALPPIVKPSNAINEEIGNAQEKINTNPHANISQPANISTYYLMGNNVNAHNTNINFNIQNNPGGQMVIINSVNKNDHVNVGKVLQTIPNTYNGNNVELVAGVAQNNTFLKDNKNPGYKKQIQSTTNIITSAPINQPSPTAYHASQNPLPISQNQKPSQQSDDMGMDLYVCTTMFGTQNGGPCLNNPLNSKFDYIFHPKGQNTLIHCKNCKKSNLLKIPSEFFVNEISKPKEGMVYLLVRSLEPEFKEFNNCSASQENTNAIRSKASSLIKGCKEQKFANKALKTFILKAIKNVKKEYIARQNTTTSSPYQQSQQYIPNFGQNSTESYNALQTSQHTQQLSHPNTFQANVPKLYTGEDSKQSDDENDNFNLSDIDIWGYDDSEDNHVNTPVANSNIQNKNLKLINNICPDDVNKPIKIFFQHHTNCPTYSMTSSLHMTHTNTNVYRLIKFDFTSTVGYIKNCFKDRVKLELNHSKNSHFCKIFQEISNFDILYKDTVLDDPNKTLADYHVSTNTPNCSIVLLFLKFTSYKLRNSQ